MNLRKKQKNVEKNQSWIFWFKKPMLKFEVKRRILWKIFVLLKPIYLQWLFSLSLFSFFATLKAVVCLTLTPLHFYWFIIRIERTYFHIHLLITLSKSFSNSRTAPFFACFFQLKTVFLFFSLAFSLFLTCSFFFLQNLFLFFVWIFFILFCKIKKPKMHIFLPK